MNRRQFFKTSGSSIATIALFPAISVMAGSTKPIKRNKEYWKRHFRDTTQENNLVDMLKQCSTQEDMTKCAELVRKRYSEDTYVQINQHTDIQIDKLPNKNGPYMVWRFLYKHKEKKFVDDISEITIEIVSTPILLEV